VRKRKNGKRIALIVLCTVLAAVLTAMVGVTVMAHSLMNKMNRVEDENSATISIQEMEQYLEEEKQQETGQGPAIRDEEVEWGQLEGTLLGESDDVINILLIGQDRRPGETRSRSDSMILCTVNRNDKTIVLTSFMRDLYVQIPGYGNNRINASYAWGGMELLNKTLEQNFGIYIDGNVEVDFEQFTEIVDLLGGVPMELRADEAQYINIDTQSSLTEGMQQLTGKQALSYSRIRNLDADADFSRTNRQRKVLNALIEKFKGSNLTTILALLDEALPMVTTDMTQAEIVSLVTEVFPLLKDMQIVSQRVPSDGTYSCPMIRGMSVVLADMDAARELLKETFGD
jgi:LCP family protein required for cell wall assembly